MPSGGVSKQPAIVLVLVILGLTPWRIAVADPGSPGLETETKAETEPLPSDTELEQAGAVFGQIRIDNKDVFDKNDPKDNKALFRLADKLHVRTRQSVIRHQLLFRSGERYSRHAIEESARILRTDRYFYDATIVPVRYHDGKVDVLVTTRDVWTLDPGFNFGRSGGTNNSGVTLQERSEERRVGKECLE